MERDIDLNGIIFTVKYDWDDDAMTNLRILKVRIKDSPDLYDIITQDTRDELLEKLEWEIKFPI